MEREGRVEGQAPSPIPTFDRLDRLSEMFARCKELQKEITGNDPLRYDASSMGYSSLAMLVEVGEVLREAKGWKNHKRTPEEVDMAKVTEELADVWHFVINLTLYAGVDCFEMMEAFRRKNDINFHRIREGY